MIRRILIAILITAGCFSGKAQTYTAKDLVGRWEYARNPKSNIIFSDTTGAWLNSDGFILNRFKYTCTVQQPGDRYMEFNFTDQISRKNPSLTGGYIKFLNDSVALLRIGWPIGKGADTSYKNAALLRKIKQPQAGTEPRLPSYKDLVGKWLTYFKKKTMTSGIRFLDSVRAVYILGEKEQLVNYQANFSRQPITLDFYVQSQLVQGYLGFYSKDMIRLELFKDKVRPDHFTVFGQNTTLTRQKEEVVASSAAN